MTAGLETPGEGWFQVLRGPGQKVPRGHHQPTTIPPSLSTPTCVPPPSSTHKPSYCPCSVAPTIQFPPQHWPVHAAGSPAAADNTSIATVHHVLFPNDTGQLGAWVAEHFNQTDADGWKERCMANSSEPLTAALGFDSSPTSVHADLLLGRMLNV